MLRPRASTSAGQSSGGAVLTALVLDGAADAVEAGAFMDLARAEKAVLLEQARQLSSGVSCCRDQIRDQIQHTAFRRARGPRLAVAASRSLSQRRWHGRLPATHCAVIPQPCAQSFSALLCSALCVACFVASFRLQEWNEQTSCRRRRHLLGLREPSRGITGFPVLGFVSLDVFFDATSKKTACLRVDLELRPCTNSL